MLKSIRQVQEVPASLAAEKPEILYLVYREGLGPVFESMVVRPLGQLRQLGYPIRLLTFAQIGDFIRGRLRRRWGRLKQAIHEQFGGPFTRLPSAPSRCRNLWNDAALISAWGRLRYRSNRSLIVHCRGPQATMLGLRLCERLPGARVIYEMKGLNYAELLYERGGHGSTEMSPETTAEVEALRRTERDAARGCDALICVSHQMAQHAAEEFAIPHDKVNVLWNYLPVERYRFNAAAAHETREALGLSDRFVVAYCGSVYRRQRLQQGLKVLQLLKRLEPLSHFLVLTTNPEKMRIELDSAELGSGDVTLLNVSHFDVPRYLAASHVGLITTGLFETPALANRVCCPVKFGEYLASGLPVIMSDSIGDYSELARRHQLGVVIPHNWPQEAVRESLGQFLSSYRSNSEGWRRRCREFAEAELSSAKHLKTVAEIYEQLSRE